MAHIANNVLELMGQTPMVRLNRSDAGSSRDCGRKARVAQSCRKRKDRIGISMINKPKDLASSIKGP
jgi:cysteine synthase